MARIIAACLWKNSAFIAGVKKPGLRPAFQY
ncbi:hypothetical protein EPYR_00863 [Erwinia pyrifoliae DSM 12163]|nr:hypothetical protein EPYR_00863 [Erwinia pyrifoliae DSM 12163]